MAAPNVKKIIFLNESCWRWALFSISLLLGRADFVRATGDQPQTLVETYAATRAAALKFKLNQVLNQCPNKEHLKTLNSLLDQNPSPDQLCYAEPALEKALKDVENDIAPLVAKETAQRILTREYLKTYRSVFKKTPHQVRQDAIHSGDPIQKLEATLDLFPAPPNPIHVWDHLRATKPNNSANAMELVGRALNGDSLDLFDRYAGHGELRGTLTSVEDGTYVKKMINNLVARDLSASNQIYDRLEGARVAISRAQGSNRDSRWAKTAELALGQIELLKQTASTWMMDDSPPGSPAGQAKPWGERVSAGQIATHAFALIDAARIRSAKEPAFAAHVVEEFSHADSPIAHAFASVDDSFSEGMDSAITEKGSSMRAIAFGTPSFEYFTPGAPAGGGIGSKIQIPAHHYDGILDLAMNELNHPSPWESPNHHLPGSQIFQLTRALEINDTELEDEVAHRKSMAWTKGLTQFGSIGAMVLGGGLELIPTPATEVVGGGLMTVGAWGNTICLGWDIYDKVQEGRGLDANDYTMLALTGLHLGAFRALSSGVRLEKMAEAATKLGLRVNASELHFDAQEITGLLKMLLQTSAKTTGVFSAAEGAAQCGKEGVTWVQCANSVLSLIDMGLAQAREARIQACSTHPCKLTKSTYPLNESEAAPGIREVVNQTSPDESEHPPAELGSVTLTPIEEAPIIESAFKSEKFTGSNAPKRKAIVKQIADRLRLTQEKITGLIERAKQRWKEKAGEELEKRVNVCCIRTGACAAIAHHFNRDRIWIAGKYFSLNANSSPVIAGEP